MTEVFEEIAAGKLTRLHEKEEQDTLEVQLDVRDVYERLP
jgi:hypothetical protein